MTRPLFQLVVIGALAAAAGASAPAPRLARTSVQVTVTPANGATLDALTANDLSVTLDGAPIAVKEVTPAPLPATIVILVDATASMPLHLLDLAPTIASGVVRGVSKGDRVRLGVISGAVRFGSSFTDDARTAVLPVVTFFTRGDPEPSPIWDAVDAAATLLDVEHGVRTIVVITDGKASGNRLGFDEMSAHAIRSGLSIDVIAEAPEVVVNQQGSKSAAAVRPSASLRALAQLTGGAYLTDGPANVINPPPRLSLAELDDYRERTRPQTDKLIDSIFAELRRTYILGIDVPSDAVPHHLDVHVRDKDATARGPLLVMGK